MRYYGISRSGVHLMDREAGIHAEPTTPWAFVRAVSSEAWIYIAYGAGTVILSIWGYYTSHVPPLWLFLAVIALGFLVGGFRTWQKERIDRNEKVATVVKLGREIDALSRPRFLPEITEVLVDGDHQQPDWIKLYVHMVIRNQGAESAIDRWTLRVVPPHPGTPFVQKVQGLSETQEGRGSKMGGNLLHDVEVIGRGGRKEGWLLCHGPKTQLGLTTGQTAAVKVSFKDVHDNEYSAIFPPAFRHELFDLELAPS
jgi:hypothetical protein